MSRFFETYKLKNNEYFIFYPDTPINNEIQHLALKEELDETVDDSSDIINSVESITIKDGEELHNWYYSSQYEGFEYEFILKSMLEELANQYPDQTVHFFEEYDEEDISLKEFFDSIMWDSDIYIMDTGYESYALLGYVDNEYVQIMSEIEDEDYNSIQSAYIYDVEFKNIKTNKISDTLQGQKLVAVESNTQRDNAITLEDASLYSNEEY